MKKMLLLTVILAWLSPAPRAQEPQVLTRQIALTFDDLPAMGPLGYWTAREVSGMILRVLERHQIPAAGFVVEEKIEEDPSTYVVLDDWAGRGHILGNQTYGDADLNQLEAEDFLEHAADGQKSIRRMARTHGFNYRYLRFPWLHQGDTERKKKQVAKALARGGYQVAHVTVKTADYAFNPLVLEYQNDQARMERLKELYLKQVERSLEGAEELSQQLFDRIIPQVLWLHAGLATAFFLEDLVQLLKGRGYQFISLPQALQDPAFTTPEDYVGPLGLSFLERVALTRGLSLPEEEEVSPARLEVLLDQVPR